MYKFNSLKAMTPCKTDFTTTLNLEMYFVSLMFRWLCCHLIFCGTCKYICIYVYI